MSCINQKILLERRKFLPDKWAECNHVRVRVESIRGVCTAGFQVGDEWILQKFTPPSEFCGITYCLLYPTIRSLVFGGKVPFAKDNILKVACPDHKNCTVFSLEVMPYAVENNDKKEEKECQE